jgi:hypothetical protein
MSPFVVNPDSTFIALDVEFCPVPPWATVTRALSVSIVDDASGNVNVLNAVVPVAAHHPSPTSLHGWPGSGVEANKTVARKNKDTARVTGGFDCNLKDDCVVIIITEQYTYVLNVVYYFSKKN